MATAYSGTKMVLEVVKESSDVFTPLKSVVGGLSAILKQYDVSSSYIENPYSADFVHCNKQYIANKEDVPRLINRVDSLSTSLTGQPQHGDIKEIERRKVLGRFVPARSYQFGLTMIQGIEEGDGNP